MKRWHAVILVLATLLAFGRVATFDFTNIEDQGLITRNPNLNPPTLHGLSTHWRQPHIGLYIPVTYTAWWLLARITQTHVPDASGATLNPWVFHSANLALHAINALLVMSLLRRLKLPDIAALIGALIVALHPIQVEAVAWTTGMKDVLCGVFALGALHQYIAAMQEAPSRRRMLRYALATLLLILAMLSKPAAVVVPVMALIIDRLLLRRSWRDVLRWTAAWFVLIVPMLLITRLVQPAADVPSSPLWARPLIAADALAFYLAKLVWPFDLTMAYGRSPQAITASHAIYWTWTIPVAIAAIIFLNRRRRWLVAAALLLVAGLLPVLGLTKFTYQQFSTVADRYMYLSMTGVALAVACAVAQHATRRTYTIAAIVVALLGVRTFMQTGTWSDEVALYRHAVRVAPDSVVPRINLAAVLFNRRDIPGAAPHAARAVALQPNNAGARRNYALILDAQGLYPQLIEQLEALDRIAPSEATTAWLAAARLAAQNETMTRPSPPAPASQPF